MYLPHSARAASAPARLLQTLAGALRGLVLGLAGLLFMAFTLLAGLVAAGVLLVVALVARRRLERSGLRFAWQSLRAAARRGASTQSQSWRGGGGHGGEIVDAEVREIRD
jgi:hypothetical protein